MDDNIKMYLEEQDIKMGTRFIYWG